MNTRPIRTPEYSVEVQRSGPAVLPPVFKNFHLITFVLNDDAIVCRKGTGNPTRTHLAAGESYIRAAGPGDWVLWPAGIHCLHIHLHPQLIQRAAAPIGVENITLESRPRLRDAEVRALCLELHHAASGESIDNPNVHAVITDLARHVVRRYSVEAPVPIRVGRLLLEETLDILRNPTGGWKGVTDLAKRAGLTRSHFSRKVRALTGLSPSRIVRGSRIEAAKHLLERTSAPLAEVAYRTGFADQSHLTRVFHRLTNMTPARYRALRSAG